MQRAIITVVGKDTIGIIAGVCTYLAENRINILDISQTIVQGYFNMMMIVDVTTLDKPFGQVEKGLPKLGTNCAISSVLISLKTRSKFLCASASILTCFSGFGWLFSLVSILCILLCFRM